MSLDESDPARSAASAARAALREVTDARTLRALAHPVRIALLETLTVEGPMTATEVGERIGESPTTCSFHLRQLAKYKFVEEAGGGKGRARPWRVTTIGMSFGGHGDPEAELAAGALVHLVRERQLERFRAWQEGKAAYPRAWQEAAGDSQFLFYLTAAELGQLNEELLSLLLFRFADRRADPSLRPPGSVPVEMLMFSYPIGVPAAAAEAPHSGEDSGQAGEGQPGEGQPPAMGQDSGRAGEGQDSGRPGGDSR